jgi:hypothetical protein
MVAIPNSTKSITSMHKPPMVVGRSSLGKTILKMVNGKNETFRN